MEQLRGQPLENRKHAYRVGRVRDQRAWYARKARWNTRRANLWTALTLLSEAVGGASAIFMVLDPALFDVPAVAAAAVEQPRPGCRLSSMCPLRLLIRLPPANCRKLTS